MPDLFLHGRDSGSPLVVSREGRIVALNEAARREGLGEGMSLESARTCWPGLEVLDYERELPLYQRQAAAVWDVCYSHTPGVEPFEVNAAFLDLTCPDAPHERALRIVRDIRRRGIAAVMGVGPGKLVARLAAERARAVAVVEDPASFLAPQPVEALWPLPIDTLRRLRRLGIATVGDLQKVPEEELVRRFGEGGREIHDLAMGVDKRPVARAYPPVKIGRRWEFEVPVVTMGPIERALTILVRDLHDELFRMGRAFGSLTLKVEGEGGVEVCTRRLMRPRHSAESIRNIVKRLLREVVRGPVAALELSLGDLEEAEFRQGLLFDAEVRRSPALERAIRSLRRRCKGTVIGWGDSILVPERRERMLMLWDPMRGGLPWSE